MNEKIEKYIDYVTKIIEYIKSFTATIYGKPDVNTRDILDIARKRHYVNGILNAEYRRIIDSCKKEEIDFRIWFSEKYSTIRSELNPDTKPGTKWLSSKDIESELIKQNKEEYKQRLSIVEDFKAQKSFMKDIMDDWKSLSFDLQLIVRILELDSVNNIDPTIKRRRK